MATAKKKAALKPRSKEGPAKKEAVTLADKLKALIAIDDKILALEAQVAALKKQYDIAERPVLEGMQAEGLESFKGAKGTAFIAKRDVASIEDYEGFMAYVFKHKASDLLQRRVALRAYQDRVANGETVPGIKVSHLISLNLRRSKDNG